MSRCTSIFARTRCATLTVRSLSCTRMAGHFQHPTRRTRSFARLATDAIRIGVARSPFPGPTIRTRARMGAGISCRNAGSRRPGLSLLDAVDPCCRVHPQAGRHPVMAGFLPLAAGLRVGDPHSRYLNTLTEQGIVGLAALAFFIFRVLSCPMAPIPSFAASHRTSAASRENPHGWLVLGSAPSTGVGRGQDRPPCARNPLRRSVKRRVRGLSRWASLRILIQPPPTQSSGDRGGQK